MLHQSKSIAARRQELGQRGERFAVHVLQSHGYCIEKTNVRFPVGEIDIIAWDGQTLCFVEVRSASSMQWGGPFASVTDRKRRRLIRAAQWYLQRLRVLPMETRFDVVGIQWDGQSRPSAELLKGAFFAE